MLRSIAPVLVMILGIIYVDIYEINRYERLLTMWLLVAIWFLMIIIGKMNNSPS